MKIPIKAVATALMLTSTAALAGCTSFADISKKEPVRTFTTFGNYQNMGECIVTALKQKAPGFYDRDHDILSDPRRALVTHIRAGAFNTRSGVVGWQLAFIDLGKDTRVEVRMYHTPFGDHIVFDRVIPTVHECSRVLAERSKQERASR